MSLLEAITLSDRGDQLVHDISIRRLDLEALVLPIAMSLSRELVVLDRGVDCRNPPDGRDDHP